MTYASRRPLDDDDSMPRARTAAAASHHAAPGEDPFSRFLGKVVGCLLGLAAGYWLLNYFGGPAFNVLGVPLPLVAHTQPGAEEFESNKSGAPRDEAEVPRRAAKNRKPAAEKRPASGDSSGASGRGSSSRLKRKSPLAEASSSQVPPTDAGQSRPSREASSGLSRRDAQVHPAAAVAPRGAEERRALAPRYSVEELDEALLDVESLIQCEACGSTGSVTRTMFAGARDRNGRRTEQQVERKMVCPTCQGHPCRVDRAGYQRLCDLALRATFVDFGSHAAEDAPARAEALAQVATRLGSDRDLRRTLGRLASERLVPASNEEGLLLAGTVESVGVQGRFTRTTLVLFGEPKKVVILSNAASSLKPREQAIIMGAVLSQPSQLLSGYDQGDDVVVWGGMPVRLAPLK